MRTVIPPALLQAALVLCAALALVEPSSAQQAPSPTPLGGRQLAELSLSEGQRVDLELPDRLLAPWELRLAFQGEWRSVLLEPHSVRAPGYRVMVSASDGQLVAAPAPAPRTVRGEVLGFPGSQAAGSLVDGRLQLLLRFERGGPLWGIEPLRDGGHALYSQAAVVGSGWVCGTYAPHGIALPASPQEGVEPGDLLDEAEIAIDADWEYYLKNSASVDKVIADVENIIEQVRLIYASAAAVSYTISSITVRSNSNDPYTSSNSSALLDEFRDYWNQSMANVQRDVAHLFTGRALFGSVIGVAYLGVVCFKTQAYGLSESKFSSNLVARVSLTAHELGHNWGAPHCDGDPDCAIMCSGLGGCTGNLQEFGGTAVSAIAQTKQASACLTTVIEPGLATLASVFPTFGKAEGGGVIELYGADLPTDVPPTVTLGGVDAPVLNYSESLITASIPSGTPGTTVDVAVVAGEPLSVLPGGYRYELEMSLGDRVTSQLTPMEVERFFFDGLSGERITLQVKPLNALEGLILGLRIIGPGEQVLVVTEGATSGKGKAVSIKKFTLEQTGEHRVEVFAIGITSGGYRLKTKGRPLKSVKDTLTVSVAQPGPTLKFSAKAGALLKQALFKRISAKGVYAQVDGQPADLLPSLLELTGPDGPVPLDDLLVLSPKGKWARVKQVPLAATGDYSLRCGGLENSLGYGKARVKLKSPKPVPTVFVLQP